MSAYKAIPLSALESWPTPNYENPPEKTLMPPFVVVWQTFSTILVSMRLFLRARNQAGGLGLDDLMIFVDWIFSIACSVTTLIVTEHYGLKRHTWDIRPDWFTPMAMYGWLTQLLFLCSTTPTKLSVLLFYRRMVKGAINKRWLYTVHGAMAITAAWGVSSIAVYLLTCKPLDALWKGFWPNYDKPYTCIDGTSFTWSVGIIGVLSDIYAVALPCFILRQYDLNISRTQKMALNIIFGLGLLVAGAGAARTYYLWKVNTSIDVARIGYELLAWSIVECQLGIIIASTPALRAFFRHVFRDTLKKSFNSKSTTYLGSVTRNSAFATIPEVEHDADVELQPQPRVDDKSLPKPPSSIDEVVFDHAGQCDVIARLPPQVEPGRGKITTAQEYEVYVLDRMRKHASMISQP